jgi:uncharacterized protein YegP (UPF0339 family)
MRQHILLAVPFAAFLFVATMGESTAQAPGRRGNKAAEEKAAAMMTFEVYKDAAGAFRFRMKDGDGNILAVSPKGLETVGDCRKAIKAIQDGAGKSKIVEGKDDGK